MEIQNGNGQDGHDEQKILVGMITDRSVVGRVSSIWQRDMFASRWGNLVARWCIEYYLKHDRPPMKDIEHKFQEWSSKEHDEATVKIVWDFLGHLSGQYDTHKRETNPEHVIDVSGKYFDRVRMRRTAREVTHYLDTGQQERASEMMLQYRPLEVSDLGAVDLYQDEENLRAAFEDEQKSLIEYDGALATFFGSALARGNFISLESPEKRGKSFLLLDIAQRAVEQRRRVAFFDAGDMGRRRVTRRFACRAAATPLRKGLLRVPERMVSTGNGLEDVPRVQTKPIDFNTALSYSQALQIFRDFQTLKVKSLQPFIKVLFRPSGTLKMSTVRMALDVWEQDGWVPDIVVIDYADIMASDTSAKDERDAINNIWISMRALSQEKHLLLVTASQTDANSYSARRISMKNFSGDKRKRAHVDGTFAINLPEGAAANNVCYLDWVAYRDDTMPGVWVAECKALANMCALSIL